ncbi:phage portal protein [Herbaspirillum sp. GCM10030257]|uniref:phage portal protein n=1 Tax=Herbaspirillum sp. GCM10030257 TaxID=3273393 RepID=UPI0036216298
MNFLRTALQWFGLADAMQDRSGVQNSGPSSSAHVETPMLGAEGALQIATVWACLDLLTKTIASLPLFLYEEIGDGKRTLARRHPLWYVLHDKPNRRMTAMVFWQVMMLNLFLRGNAYARIDRNAKKDVIALWPMMADQIQVHVLTDGTVVYQYYKDGNITVLHEDNVVHIRLMGNGTIGLSPLDHMRSTLGISINAQNHASRTYANGAKRAGVLMMDKALSPEQRTSIKAKFADLVEGDSSPLKVLEFGAKYEQLSMSPQDIQLLETRRFSVEEIARWFGVPPIMIGDMSVSTTLGSSTAEIIELFFKKDIRPQLENIEQELKAKVLNPAQRTRMTVEFSFDALLRSSLKDRMEIYAKAVQNGLKTRNEVRQLENDPPIPGADALTAQTNLAPLEMLGKLKPTGGNNGTQDAVSQ